MKDDLINRQAAIREIRSNREYLADTDYIKGLNAGIEYSINAVENLPLVQPKCGHWVHDGFACYCSECKKSAHKDYNKWDVFSPGVWILNDFCPNCGADMREE